MTGCNSSLAEKLTTLSMISMHHSHGWIHSLSLPFPTFVTAEQIQRRALSQISVEITKNLLLTRFFFLPMPVISNIQPILVHRKGKGDSFPHSHN